MISQRKGCTIRLCCISRTEGPSARELRVRQKWLRVEIDKKETTLQTVSVVGRKHVWGSWP